jgi:hypothetical protein
MFSNYLKPFLAGVIITLIFLTLKECKQPTPLPEPVTITKIEYITKIDTIIKTKLSKPSIKYVDNTKIKDSIIYVDKSNDNAVELYQTNTKLITDNGEADLNIKSLGEIISIDGTISNNETIITKETTKTINNSGAFLYLESSIKPVLTHFQLGLDYQIKNKYLLGVSISHNTEFKATYINAKVGINIF